MIEPLNFFFFFLPKHPTQLKHLERQKDTHSQKANGTLLTSSPQRNTGGIT